MTTGNAFSGFHNNMAQTMTQSFNSYVHQTGKKCSSSKPVTQEEKEAFMKDMLKARGKV